MKKKTVKEVKMIIFLVFACKYQDYQNISSQKNFALPHDSETVTFKNSAIRITLRW